MTKLKLGGLLTEASANIKQAIDKMDKWMPEDDNLMEDFYDLVDDHDVKHMVAFLEDNADYEVLARYLKPMSPQSIEALAKELIRQG